MRILSSEALWRGTTPAYHSPSADEPRKKSLPRKGKDAFAWYHLAFILCQGAYGNQKAPVHSGTGARSRYHPALYFNGYSVTGTSVPAYYLRPGSSRVIDHGHVAPVFTIHRLSEASNFRFPLVHSMYLFELDCKYNGYTQVCQMEILSLAFKVLDLAGSTCSEGSTGDECLGVRD